MEKFLACCCVEIGSKKSIQMYTSVMVRDVIVYSRLFSLVLLPCPITANMSLGCVRGNKSNIRIRPCYDLTYIRKSLFHVVQEMTITKL